MGILRKRLQEDHPNAIEVALHWLEKFAPEMPSGEPVTLPRDVFDSLCLVALVGLEALDLAKESDNAN